MLFIGLKWRNRGLFPTHPRPTSEPRTGYVLCPAKDFLKRSSTNVPCPPARHSERSEGSALAFGVPIQTNIRLSIGKQTTY